MTKPGSPFAGKKLTEGTPFAKTSVEQRLFSNSPTQDSAEKPKAAEETRAASKPAQLTPNLTNFDKVEKYTTHLEPNLIKKIKHVAIEKDMKDYDVVRAALIQYFEKNT
jgi:hypothetical protein